jgi:hypothetical protein
MTELFEGLFGEESITEEEHVEMDVGKQIRENFEFLTAMSIPEYTFYRKWQEINRAEWSKKDLGRIAKVKKNLWSPESPDDYKNLNIKVIHADTPDTLLTWRALRLHTSTASWNQNPGRNLRFYVVHEEYEEDMWGEEQPVHKYLGTISLGSDFIAIGGRDKVIKWTKEDKMEHGMLKHTAMGSSIVPTQPVGFNYLGGKLISLMVISDVVEKAWNEKYAEKLVGVTTTSLYGGFSQYNNLKYWKKCKSSLGEVALEPSEETYELLKNYCKTKFPEDYKSYVSPKTEGAGCSIPSHPKTKIMARVFKDLKIRAPKNNAPRGVYWAPLYEQSNEFLRREVTDPGNKKFDNSVEALSTLWKERYAGKRINKLSEEGRTNMEILFYDDLKGMTWEDAKEKYLGDVGR